MKNEYSIGGNRFLKINLHVIVNANGKKGI
jgi:hypothetical protein